MCAQLPNFPAKLEIFEIIVPFEFNHCSQTFTTTFAPSKPVPCPYDHHNPNYPKNSSNNKPKNSDNPNNFDSFNSPNNFNVEKLNKLS